MKLSLVKLDQISAGENIRKDITKESLASLIDSIKEKGILQPMLVRMNGTKFDLLDGYRRYNAAKHAGIKEVPVLAIKADADDRVEYQLITNLQRKDLNPIDEALAYKELGENYLPKDIMVVTGKSEYRIKRILALLNLCPEVKEMIKKGVISEDHGFVLTRLSNPKFQKALAGEIKRYRYSPAKAEGELENYSQRLESACFDRTQCKTCAFNGSGFNDLFDRDNSLKGKCMNEDCFFKKIGEEQKKVHAELKAKGKKVIIVKKEPRYGSKDYEALKDIVDFSGYEAQAFPKEQFKTECTGTCPTFAYIIGPTAQVKPVCLNKDCFKRSLRKAKAIERKANALPKTGNAEKDASIQYEARQKANRVDFFKREFYIKALKENAKDVQFNRILLDQLFQMESGGAETIAEYLNLKEKKANYMIRDLKILSELTNAKLVAIIRKLVLNRLPKYTTEELQALGEEASISIGKQFRVTKEYLEKFTKAGLQKLSKELKLKIGTDSWKEKKSEIIKEMLPQVKSKVPKEIIK